MRSEEKGRGGAPLTVELIASRARGRRQWRVRLLRAGRVLLWSEHYTRRRAAEGMFRRLVEDFAFGRWRWREPGQ